MQESESQFSVRARLAQVMKELRAKVHSRYYGTRTIHTDAHSLLPMLYFHFFKFFLAEMAQTWRMNDINAL